MSTERNTAVALRYSVIIGIITIAIGIAIDMFGHGTDILWAGLFLLIISPLIGVIATTVSLIIEKDTKWVAVAIALIAISVIGMLLK